MSSLATTHTATLHARAYRTIRVLMKQSLERYDITVTGWALLGIIAQSDGVRPSAIADQLGVKRPLVTNLIKTYVRRGLVSSTSDATDARTKLIILTPQGERLTANIETSLQQDMHGMLDEVSVADLTTYFRVLRVVAHKLDT